MKLDGAKFVVVRTSGYPDLEKIVYNGKLYMEQRSGKTWYGKAYDVVKANVKWFREFQDNKYTGNILLKFKGRYELRSKAQLNDWIKSLQLAI